MANLLDTRSLTKPDPFSGEEKDFPGWDFTFRSYLNLLSPRMETLLNQAMVLPDPPDTMDMDEDTVQLSAQLFHLLVMLCKRGRPLNILMAGERGNGFSAYRQIKLEYEPRVGGRHAIMLTALLNPQ